MILRRIVRKTLRKRVAKRLLRRHKATIGLVLGSIATVLGLTSIAFSAQALHSEKAEEEMRNAKITAAKEVLAKPLNHIKK